MKLGWALPALLLMLSASMVGCSSARYQTAKSADSERLMGIAKLFQQQGQTRLAADMYGRILADHPGHQDAQMRLAELQRQLNSPGGPTPVMLADRTANTPQAADAGSGQTPEPSPVQLTGTTEQTDTAPGPETISSADLEIANTDDPEPNPFEIDEASEFDAPAPVEDDINPFEVADNEADSGSDGDDGFEMPTIEAAGSSDRIAELTRQLASDDAGQRLIAAFDLGEIGGEAQAALPVLSELLTTEEDAMVRVLYAEAIAKINVGDASALEVLRASLDNEDDSVTQIAVLAVSDVITDLSDAEDGVGHASLRDFGPQVRDAMEKALDHDATIVRTAARNVVEIIDEQ